MQRRAIQEIPSQNLARHHLPGLPPTQDKKILAGRDTYDNSHGAGLEKPLPALSVSEWG